MVSTARLTASPRGAINVDVLRASALPEAIGWVAESLAQPLDVTVTMCLRLVGGGTTRAPLVRAVCARVNDLALHRSDEPRRAPRRWGVSPREVQGVCHTLRHCGYNACDEFFRSKFPATVDTRARRAVRLVYICAGAHLVPDQRRVLCALTRVKFSAATNNTFRMLVKCIAGATRACTWEWGLGVVCAVVAARAIGASPSSVRSPGAARIVANKCPDELRELDEAAAAVLGVLP